MATKPSRMKRTVILRTRVQDRQSTVYKIRLNVFMHARYKRVKCNMSGDLYAIRLILYTQLPRFEFAAFT